jgi:hypothetical protein
MTPDETPALPDLFPGGEGGSQRRPPREDWAPVPGWPYEASSRGRVRSLARGVPLKQQRDKDGYRHVELSDGKRRRRAHVAVLVLEAFTGPCPPECEALHGNGRRWDNRLANLRWGTRPENRQERERHRRERDARRAERADGGDEDRGKNGWIETEGEEEKQVGMEGTACCPLETGTGVSQLWARCCCSRPV